MKKIFFVISLIVVLLAPVLSEALPVTVVNPGFEDVILTDGSAIGSIYGWTIEGYRAGTYNPTTVQYPSGIPGESNVAFVREGSSISQLLNYWLIADTQLTLSVDVGWRNDILLPSYEIQLLAGGNVLTSLSNYNYSLIRGDYVPVQLTYDVLSGNSLINQQVSIAFINTGLSRQVHFDNVELNNDPIRSVPEPSTLLLLGSGLLGFGIFARKRKK